jgi:hypothetical protein
MKGSSTPISSPASTFQAVDINEGLASRNSTLNDTLMVHSDVENSEANNPSLTGNQLKKGNLSATEVFRAVINTKNLIHEQIPSGTKENIYLLLDNTKNVLRQQTGTSSVYPDDCGAWDSHSGQTVETDFIVLPDDFLRYTVLKDEKYCYEKQVKGKKTFVPLDPQPERDNVVTLTRYYTPLKRDKNFKKRVSNFNCLPARHSLRENVALVEYTGTYPKRSQTHGNAKLHILTCLKKCSKQSKTRDQILTFTKTWSYKIPRKHQETCSRSDQRNSMTRKK